MTTDTCCLLFIFTFSSPASHKLFSKPTLSAPDKLTLQLQPLISKFLSVKADTLLINMADLTPKASLVH